MPQDFQLTVNGATRRANVEPDTPLLYILRNDLELNGPRFGCGLSQCGACTVLVDGRPTRSCVTTVSSLGAKQITTLEGLGSKDRLHPLQKAFIEEQAVQWLLHQRHDHDRQGPARQDAQTDGSPDQEGAGGELLPLRHS